mgnify:CR=1 FL=1
MGAISGADHILCVVGARPNFMKIAPIMRAFSSSSSALNARLLHTGQHYDASMKHAFFEQLNIPEPDVDLEVGSGTHAEQTAEIMKRFEPVLDSDPPRAVLVVGDVNVANEDLDIGIGPDNAKRWLRTGKCSFLPEERDWLRRLIDWGLVDTFRQCHPETDDQFSWFDYRRRGVEASPQRGLRIDLMLASSPLSAACVGAGIDYDIRAMEKPSDHAPIWAEFDLD